MYKEDFINEILKAMADNPKGNNEAVDEEMRKLLINLDIVPSSNS